MRSGLLEVPFIVTYRREFIEPEMSADDLWIIYKWDEKYCQLVARRENMVRLFKNMQSYQIEQLTVNNYSDDRTISDNDIERVASVTSFEELHDVWVQFQLYYSRDIPAMKKEVEKRAREQRRQERQAARMERLQNHNEDDPELPPEEDDEEDEEAINTRFSTLKLAQRKDLYTICKESGIAALAKNFGLTAEQLGENIRDNYTKHEVEQCRRLPVAIATDYICTRFPSDQAALQAARFMVAKEISSNPLIRQCIRSAFNERAVANVRPTAKGLKEIDENHPCYPTKYQKERPLFHFKDMEFLHLLQAEEDGLVTIQVTIDRIKPNSMTGLPEPYLNEIIQLYMVDEFSDVVNKWNEERRSALEMALNKMLYPVLEKEMKAKMKQEALQIISMQCGRKLREQLFVAPYVPPGTVTDDEDFDLRDGLRVLGFAFTTDTGESCFAALIDGDGEVTDHLRLPHFMLKPRGHHSGESDVNLKEKDIQRLKNFIAAKKPHVIALGANSIITRYVFNDLMEIISHMSQNDAMPTISVEVVDDSVAAIYQSSRRANTDFPDYPPLLRQAVSLARRLQDPLVEFCQLCSPDEEISCLKLDPLQDKLSREEILETINIEFVNAVNRVGVDVNRALAHPHTSSMVQFIAGFGPRKAAGFLRTLKKLPAQCLESRTQLIMNCKFGAKVFINCAGFIKIDTNQLSDSPTETYIEVLDSTRVHPEAYEWARKMAVDALEYDDENEANPSNALEEILENPNRLDDLDLEAFAKELEKQGYGNKLMTLYDIRSELSSRFKDPRNPYTQPADDQLFNLLTKETTDSLHNGKLITVTVTRIQRKLPQEEDIATATPSRSEETNMFTCPFCSRNTFEEISDVWEHFDQQKCPGKAIGVHCRLDNGVHGFIRLENLSDSSFNDPEERVRPGMIIHARILKVNPEKFSVDLVTKSSHLNDTIQTYRPNLGQTGHYDYEAEEEDTEKIANKQAKTKKQKYIKRIIVHPAFHNIDFNRAEKMMSKMSPGDAIIRPSSKGEDHLTLTWKVHKGIIQHVDIQEKGKENAFSLGKQLIVNGEPYEDLDEILARFVQPMAAHARDLISFRYFRNAEGGKRDVMEEYLKEERKNNDKKIHYFISASLEFPGKFLLSYYPGRKVVHEYVTVTPEGFRYRGKVFSSVNQLFRWFKDHFRDPPPMSAPSAYNAASMPRSSAYSASPMVMGTPTPSPKVVGTPNMYASHRSHAGYSASPMVMGTPTPSPKVVGTPNNYPFM
jgi:transcription elongation factor SPT6